MVENEVKDVQSQAVGNNAIINSYGNGQGGAAGQKGAQNNTQSAKNVVGIFSSRDSAERAVQELRRQGFTTEEISIVTKEGQADHTYDDDDISDGVLTGGTIGGIGGLILGAGAMAIPGIGPIMAAGPIAAALGGAAVGGIAGGLIDWGIPAEESKRYEQSVAQGDILAIVRADAAKVNQAAQVFRDNGAKDVTSHNLK